MINTLMIIPGWCKVLFNMLAYKQEVEVMKEEKYPDKVGERCRKKAGHEIPGRAADFISTREYMHDEEKLCSSERSINSRERAGPRIKNTAERRYAM
ncbi:MAG: hypothetical protein H0Z40_08450 [Desulfotomaculum sp.]|nr:hypothetical protein [Desulfotomaculum sp.]